VVAIAAPEPLSDEAIDSTDILARDAGTTPVLVKHVLIGWKRIAKWNPDPRAALRSNVEAAKLAKDTLAALQADPTKIDVLIKELGEDPGAASGEPYEVSPDTPFVPEFKALALRLHENEAGIVRTNFGYHVMLRIVPPPPDPLESADILAREPSKNAVIVQHILIQWAGRPATTSSRTKAEADELATKTLARVRHGDDMKRVMAEVSEDPGSASTGQSFDIDADSAMVAPFKAMSLRLEVGEAGLVQSKYGWHVIKRIAPPPPDKLTTVAILERTDVAQATKVKHILLGWTDRHASDPRGETRTRAQLEKLVKATVAKLKKGAPIEPLMKELSEDPGSAETGEAYDATPTAGLVKPFLNMSLRLKVGEVGVVDTEFGIHIIKRVE
jgi:parvulin-like peptidyl-prolyl isomerase